MEAARKTRATPNTTRPASESAEPEATNAVGMLDLVLPEATLGTLRRFWPDSSLVRYANQLDSRPGTVARRAAKLADGDSLDKLREAADGLGRVLPEVSAGRLDILS